MLNVKERNMNFYFGGKTTLLKENIAPNYYTMYIW